MERSYNVIINIHFVKKGYHWETKEEGHSNPLSWHHTQANAIDKGKDIVHFTDGGELVIHVTDGKIRDKKYL